MADTDTDPTAPEIDVKQAVVSAKAFAREMYADEGVGDPTLEEVWFDEGNNVWLVTLGIRRHMFRTLMGQAQPVEYRVVRISGSDGKPLSIRLHESAL